MDIKQIIKEKRPNLSKQSISTYASILKNLHSKVFPGDEFSIEDFEYTQDVLDYLKDAPPRNRKTILSALVVITDLPEYREQMLSDIEDYNEEESMQIKNKKQVNSWITSNDIKNVFDHYRQNAMHIYKKKNLEASDLQQIQNFIILCLLSGVFIPPRRSKDYVEFKIKNINKDTDNYLDKSNLVFNTYKTAKTYGRQTVEIPRELKTILNKWIKVNPTDYLLFDTNMSKMTNVKLTQRLNKIFDKNVSVNQLRHTYLSERYHETINTTNKMKKDMSMMGTSILQEKVYIKS